MKQKTASQWLSRMALWFEWTLTSAAAISISSLVLVGTFALLSWLDMDFVFFLLGQGNWGYAIGRLSNILVGGAIGAALGAGQAFVLRHHIRQAASWVRASAIGMAIGNILSFTTSGIAYDIVYGSRPVPFPANDPGGAIAVMAIRAAVVGVAVGMAQWLILRRQVHWAGWWVLASMLAWSGGIIAGHFGGAVLYSGWGLWGFGWDTMGGLFIRLLEPQGLPIVGAVVGALTGLALVILLGKRASATSVASETPAVTSLGSGR